MSFNLGGWLNDNLNPDNWFGSVTNFFGNTFGSIAGSLTNMFSGITSTLSSPLLLIGGGALVLVLLLK